MQPERRHGAWLVEIQALRGFAVLGVILHHMYGNLFVQKHRVLDWMQAHLDYWTGVDLFFAISGFVIARALLPALARCRTWSEKRAVIGGFWIRRAARLWPSAWLWLGIILLASIAFNRGGFFLPVQANIWATICGIFNVANFRATDAFMRFDYGASFAWWSLSLEEQFYLLLPLAAVVTGRFLPAVLLAEVAAQLPYVRGIGSMFFRTDAIALGVLLAMAPASIWRPASLAIRKLPPKLMMVPVLCLLAALGVLGTEAWTFFRFRVGAIALISTALVFLAAQDSGLLIGSGALRRGLAWVGARSYALYLIHIPAIFAAREIWYRLGGAGDYVQLLTAAPLMLVLAEANFRWVEQPCRRIGAAFADGFAARHLIGGNSAHVA